jgi:drug/metabolite transporter (DMT)-like permease
MALTESLRGLSHPARPALGREAPTGICLAVLYLVWGSTYLAMRVAVQSFPPLAMCGARFLTAGALLYAILRMRGTPAPSARQWRAAGVVGVLLLAGGIGGVSIAVQRVSSGLAALVIGTVPLWVTLFGAAKDRPRWPELVGLALGLGGVALAGARGGLAADPAAAVLLLASAWSYAAGLVLARRLSIPAGTMGVAAEMIVGGVTLLALAGLRGERIVGMPSPSSVIALVHLVVLGSMVGYTALGWLLQNARPAVATSYAYVNPIVALALGAAIGGERVGLVEITAVALVIGAVYLTVRRQPGGHPRPATTPRASTVRSP